MEGQRRTDWKRAVVQKGNKAGEWRRKVRLQEGRRLR